MTAIRPVPPMTARGGRAPEAATMAVGSQEALLGWFMKKRIPHRIKADPSRQVPASGYSRPPEIYTDQYPKCRDCGREFLFSAEEQRAWYEEFGIPHHATAARCRDCAAIHKASANVKEQYDAASNALKQSPDDPAANLQFAKIAFVYRQALKPGGMEDVVGALNRTLRLAPQELEAYYWLALCHEKLGRLEKARIALATFVERTKDKRSGELKKLRKNAEAWLARMGAS